MDPDSGEGGKRNKTYEFGSGTPEQYFRNKHIKVFVNL
jgi:hypothetical protein